MFGICVSPQLIAAQLFKEGKDEAALRVLPMNAQQAEQLIKQQARIVELLERLVEQGAMR